MVINCKSCSFKKRNNKGKVAEKVFEIVCLNNNYWFCNYGINKDIPKYAIQHIPQKVLKTPDYMCVSKEFYFVECKMADTYTGEHVKIKEKDLIEYQKWLEVGKFVFFIYNPKFSEKVFLDIVDLFDLLQSNNYKKGTYDESGKIFYQVPMDDIRRLNKTI